MSTSKTKKIRLGVIFGGAGPEHEASLSSAKALYDRINSKEINSKEFEIELFGITKDGDWIVGSDAWNRLYREANEKLLPRAIRSFPKDAPIGDSECLGSFPPLEIFRSVDCIFPLVHGFGGEDGSLHGLLSFVAKPIVGCSLASSVQSYKKYTAKKLVESAEIDLVQAAFLPGWLSDAEMVQRVKREFDGNWNLIVKPNACGSSFGVSKIAEEADLLKAIKAARLFDKEIVVEEYVEAVELFIGVMGRQPDVIVAPPVVDAPQRTGLYTYFDKYISETYKNQCPSGLSEEVEERAKEIARRVYAELGCDSYARVDLFYVEESGKLYFNELNSPPALSPDCAFPLAMAKIGYTYEELIERLVDYALKGDSGNCEKNVLKIESGVLEQIAHVGQAA